LIQHKVKSGESLASIANDYGVSQYAIVQANNFSKHTRFYPGKDIIVPLPSDSKTGNDQEPTIHQPMSSNTHRVKQGDNLWTIAQIYHTTPEALRRLNMMDKSGRLYVGQVLKLPTGSTRREVTTMETADRKPAGETNTYIVKKGDTMWDIAQKFATTTATLRKLNGLNRNSQILVGQKLLVTGPESGGAGDEFHIYVVRRGDNLDKIARAFGTSVKTLMQLNNIEDATRVKVGMKLKINLQ
jgi:membrane-bound lytic murein transglycosylase D